MKKRLNNLFITLLIFSALSLGLWLYVFDTYEIKFNVEYRGEDTILVEAVSLNAFGIKTPFRNPECKFDFYESYDKVSLMVMNRYSSLVRFEGDVELNLIKLSASSPLSRWKNILNIPLKNSEEI